MSRNFNTNRRRSSWILSTARIVSILLCLLLLGNGGGGGSNSSNGNGNSSVNVGRVVEGLTIGRRRILCTTPMNGNEDVDALLDPKPTIPIVTGFVGCQSIFPLLSKCPNEVSIQPPWYSGDAMNGGGGVCPLEYINMTACLPGIVIILASFVWNYLYIDTNRLLITGNTIGIIHTNNDNNNNDDDDNTRIQFLDIKNWYMTPIGLVVQHDMSTNNIDNGNNDDNKMISTTFFPLYWDQKSVEAVLEDRVPN